MPINTETILNGLTKPLQRNLSQEIVGGESPSNDNRTDVTIVYPMAFLKEYNNFLTSLSGQYVEWEKDNG